MILSWELSVYTLRHKNIGSLAGQGVCVCVFGGAVMKAEDKQGNVEQGVSPACQVQTLNGHLCSQAAA